MIRVIELTSVPSKLIYSNNLLNQRIWGGGFFDMEESLFEGWGSVTICLDEGSVLRSPNGNQKDIANNIFMTMTRVDWKNPVATRSQ